MVSDHLKCKSMPSTESTMPFISGRRQFLRTMTFILLAPIWTIACERKQGGVRQGANKMHANQNQAAQNEATPQRDVPFLDTQIPADVQIATFAMG